MCKSSSGASLVVQWLRFHASTAGGEGSIRGWRSSTCCAVWPKINNLKKKVVWCHEGWVEERNCKGSRRDLTGGCCRRPKQERMGRGRGYLEAKAQDFWTFWQRRPMGPAGGTPSSSAPSANTGNTESKMVWLQALGVLLPGWRTSPAAPTSPHATAKERPEEDKTEKNLRGNRQHWVENQGHMVSEEPRGVKGVESH